MDTSSNVKTGKKRVRATQACVTCRKKKIKCDGTKPECIHCQEAKVTCEYTESKKRGPRKGYVQLLEERLSQLERLLTKEGREVPPPIAVESPTYSTSSFESKEKQVAVPNQDNDFPPPEIVTHLIDLFFQYINSAFPFVHRSRLKQSIQDGTVSKPLVWSVMAISARFSDHPSIKTNPPYWAGERFAQKAISLINSSLLEPTISNVQFWGIMSCLEYGRASGSRSWLFGGIAVRICQELSLNREETQRIPILKPDGSVDYPAMALRRRIFWSCLLIDKFASTSTNKPQGFEMGDYDTEPPSAEDSLLLRDPVQCYTLDNTPITTDPLAIVIQKYIDILERFGELRKHMSRAKSSPPSEVNWPPINQFDELHQLVKHWGDELPDELKFTEENLELYKKTSSQNYLSFWLTAHLMYHTAIVSLHRGSLAYSELTKSDVRDAVYNPIQNSISACKDSVATAMDVFKNLADICGCNMLPYMGYSAYIFSTVLMTLAFSSDPTSYKKSSEWLAILFGTMETLGPYWPMSERLATTTRDMLSVHSRLYDVEEQQAYNEARKTKALNLNKQFTPQVSEPVNNTSSPYQYTPYASELPLPIQPQTQPQQSIPQNIQSQPEHQSPQQQPMLQNQPLPQQQQQQQYDNTLTSTSFPIYGLNSSVDFNSCEFLQDSELFGQIVFDNTRNTSNINGPLSMNPVNYISPQPTVSYRQSSSVYQPNIASNSPMSNQYTDTSRPNYW